MRGGARALVTAARLPVAAYFLLTATSLLLAFIPFTYVSLVQSQVVPALVIFARAHPYLHWVAVVLVAATFARELRGGPGRLDAVCVLLMLIAAGVWLFLNKPLAAPRNDRASLILALGSLVPLLAIAIVDFASSRGRLTWLDAGSGEDRRQFHAAWQSAILAPALYLGVAFFQHGAAAFGAWPRPLLVCVWTLSAHLALFMGLFVAAQLVRGLARVLPRPAVWEFIAFTLALAGGVAALLVRWVFPAIAFRGPDAWIAAGGVAVAIAATLAGLALRGRALEDRVVESGLELALSPLAPGPRAGLLLRWVSLAVALALSGAAVILAARMDWNQLLQRTAVVAGWLLVYAAIYSVNRPTAGRRDTVLPLLLGAALSLGAFKGVQAATPHSGRWLKTPTADMQEMVEDFAAREPAFGVLYGAFTRRVAGGAEFYRFIEFLKTTSLYNRSLIVLTSDHGDSLGEGGRFGHAYTMFPEILRIPLIVHLPDALRSSVSADTSRVAFLTDISPTLHYLLDYRPVAPHELFGRPLFAAAGDAAPMRGEGWLVASSYGPVHGALGANGETLFISDIVNYREYYFDLLRDPTASRNLVTPAVIEQNHGFIRQKLETLNRFYGVPSLTAAAGPRARAAPAG